MVCYTIKVLDDAEEILSNKKLNKASSWLKHASVKFNEYSLQSTEYLTNLTFKNLIKESITISVRKIILLNHLQTEREADLLEFSIRIFFSSSPQLRNWRFAGILEISLGGQQFSTDNYL